MNNEYDCKIPLEYQITDYDCGTTKCYTLFIL